MSHSVEISSPAKLDMEEILYYISFHLKAPDAANNLLQGESKSPLTTAPDWRMLDSNDIQTNR